MRTPFSPPAVSEARPFRASAIPAPEGEAALAALKLREWIADERPIDLEIGCGVGWHPIAYARENAGRNLIAIERTAEKFGKFRARLARQPASPNLVAVHADAVAWIAHFVPDGVCDRIFLLYPNPNPKNAQARWIRMPFFGALVKKLRRGGSIEIRTNVAAYADEIAAHAPAWGLDVVEDRRFSAEEVAPASARTHFERKYLGRGETCRLLRLAPRETLR